MGRSSRTLTLAFLMVLVGLPAYASFAAEVVHTPPAANQLPSAGDELQLELILTGTTDIDLPVKLFLNRDGKLEIIDIDPGHLGVRNNVVRDFTIYSPRRSLEYRFLIQQNGKSEFSDYYAVERDCQVDFGMTSPEIAELAATEDERVAMLAADASELEKEITQAAEALELVKTLKELLQ